MATIKLQPSGKVVLKDGKVACECCTAPPGPGPGCCLYPAQCLADAIYTADDLPDNVTVNGASFPRSGTAYGNTTNGVIFEEDVWAKYTSGVRSSRPCLIQDGVEDQFADSYLVEMQMFYDYVRGNCIVTRTGRGIWEGTAYGVGAGSWVPSTPLFDDASVDLNVKLTLCDGPGLTVQYWEIRYEPFAYHCVNLDPTWPGDCQSAIESTGPGAFLNSPHQKWSVDIEVPGQYQSSPDQGSGMYQYSGYFDTNLYNGLPLFGSKVS